MGGISRNSDGDPNLLNANRNDDGQWLNTTYDRPDNEWNRDNGFAFVVASKLSLFSLSLIVGRVFLYKTSIPAAKIFADRVQFFRKRYVFFVINGFCFPKNIEKYFQNVRFSDCQPDIGNFFLWF